jgi:hypothetical protein
MFLKIAVMKFALNEIRIRREPFIVITLGHIQTCMIPEVFVFIIFVMLTCFHLTFFWRKIQRADENLPFWTSFFSSATSFLEGSTLNFSSPNKLEHVQPIKRESSFPIIKVKNVLDKQEWFRINKTEIVAKDYPEVTPKLPQRPKLPCPQFVLNTSILAFKMPCPPSCPACFQVALLLSCLASTLYCFQSVPKVFMALQWPKIFMVLPLPKIFMALLWLKIFMALQWPKIFMALTWPKYLWPFYRVFKLDLSETKHLLGHQKCTFKS